MVIVITIKARDHDVDWHRIREEVFMKEQGFQNEFDEIDAFATHIVLYVNEQPIGCGRIYPDQQDQTLWHLGRLAVMKNHRSGGYGKRVLLALEQNAKKQGAASITLSAQLQAKAFYEACGYEANGEIYMDEHVPHQDMKKLL